MTPGDESFAGINVSAAHLDLDRGGGNAIPFCCSSGESDELDSAHEFSDRRVAEARFGELLQPGVAIDECDRHGKIQAEFRLEAVPGVFVDQRARGIGIETHADPLYLRRLD